MNNQPGFIPFTEEISNLLPAITSSPSKHALWLNTLSFLENCGARKIAACEHPTKVKCDMLKHAAEEFRHAYHLKLQIKKVSPYLLLDYSHNTLLAPKKTVHFLPKLDLNICRFLKHELATPPQLLKEIAYILVTFAIEKRASILYPIYQHTLTSLKSNVSMRAIIADEDRHLADMELELNKFPNSSLLISYACSLESSLFQEFLQELY